VLLVSDVEATFVQPLAESTVTEDEEAEFTCELSKPDALVKWLKNGVELSASEHIGFETVGCKRTLKLHKSVLDDAATYQCQIASSGASSQAQLNVTGLLLKKYDIQACLYTLWGIKTQQNTFVHNFSKC